jgi:hypothetical protein
MSNVEDYAMPLRDRAVVKNFGLKNLKQLVACNSGLLNLLQQL